MPIADRSISSLIRPQGIGDLYQIYALCKRNSFVIAQLFIPLYSIFYQRWQSSEFELEQSTNQPKTFERNSQ